MTTFPNDFNAIRVTFARLIHKVTGLQSIIEEPVVQGAPRPDLPYFSFKIITPAAKDGDDSSQYVSGTIWNVGGQRKMTVSFHVYALRQEDAYNYMGLWQSSLELKTIQEQLRKAGIAVWIIGNLADFSQLLNTGFEGRAQMDVQFGIAFNLTEDTGEIATVDITGTQHTDSGTIVESFEVSK